MHVMYIRLSTKRVDMSDDDERTQRNALAPASVMQFAPVGMARRTAYVPLYARHFLDVGEKCRSHAKCTQLVAGLYTAVECFFVTSKYISCLQFMQLLKNSVSKPRPTRMILRWL